MTNAPQTLVQLLAGCFLAAPLALPVAAATACQEDPPAERGPDQREDIAERLKVFDALVQQIHKQRKPDAVPAVSMLDGFLADFDSLGPLDRISMVESLGNALKVKRIYANEDGEPQVQLYYATVVALGEMGPECVKPLADALEHKPFQKLPSMLVAMAESLGQARHLSALKPLTKLLSHKNLEVFAAAARACGQLEGLEEKRRKELFKRLLKDLAGLRAKVDDDPEDVEAYQNWGIVSGALLDAMANLAGHEEKTVAGWEAWWSEHRKQTWE